MKLFKENMETIRNTVDTENLPAYRRLLTEEYWKISDDQFRRSNTRNNRRCKRRKNKTNRYGKNICIF